MDVDQVGAAQDARYCANGANSGEGGPRRSATPQEAKSLVEAGVNAPAARDKMSSSALSVTEDHNG